MARTYETVGWQDGSVLQPAKVTVQGTEYEVTPEVISGTTPVNATNLRKMDNEIKKIVEEDIPSVLDVKLIAVSDTAPAECVEGDKYFNTTNNKIYTAIGTDTWGSETEYPVEGINYIVFETQTSYAYNGTTLVSVGGGSGTSDIVMVNEEPTEDTKLLIESEDLDFQGSEIVDEHSESNKVGYSASYTNARNTYSTDEVDTGKTWVDGKKIYRKVIYIGSLPNNTSSYTNHNISNLGIITHSEMNWYDASDTQWFNNIRWDNNTTYAYYKISATQIAVKAVGTNWSTRTSNCYVVIEYTKTS